MKENVRELKVVRAVLGLKCDDLADRIGMGHTHYRMVECGQRNFPVVAMENLKKLIEEEKKNYPLLKHIKLNSVPLARRKMS